MQTSGPAIYNAPVALMDVGPLIEIGQGNKQYLAHKGQKAPDSSLPADLMDPLDLLKPLMMPGQCTLLIPRFALQEFFTMQSPLIEGGTQEFGLKKSSRLSSTHTADIALDNPGLEEKWPGLCALFNTSPPKYMENGAPLIRYYSTPEEFIDNGELKGAIGGIAIIDTNAPLSENGHYLSTRSKQSRGDDQIRVINKAFNKAHDYAITFPVLSSDKLLINTAVKKECSGHLCRCKPFPMNLRALSETYYELKELNIDHGTRAALYTSTNRRREADKTPETTTVLRKKSADAGVKWLSALRSKAHTAGTIVSQAHTNGTACLIGNKSRG